MTTEKSNKEVRVIKTPQGIYEFALPTHGAFKLSSLKQVDLFFKAKQLKYKVVKDKANFSNEAL